MKQFIDVSFPSLSDMAAFVKRCKPMINDYNSETKVLRVENHPDFYKPIALLRGKILEEASPRFSLDGVVTSEYLKRVDDLTGHLSEKAKTTLKNMDEALDKLREMGRRDGSKWRPQD